MMRDLLHVLVVDDSPEDAELLVRELGKSGMRIESVRVQTPAGMREALESREWDLILADYSLPQFDALAALEILHESERDIPFVVLSGAVGEDAAVSVMKAGAHDFLTKDRLNRLVPAVERELRDAVIRRERRQVEAQLLQAQKMEAVGRLAGGIAHDFNNILMLVMGNAQLVLDELDPASRVYPYITQIENASKRAAGLTAQLLTFSRKQAAHMRQVSLNEVLDETHAMLDRLLGEDIDLQIEKATDIGAIRADPTQLSQVIINLAINSRDAMPEGGPLEIRTRRIAIVNGTEPMLPGLTPGEWVLLEVHDFGHGMSPEVQNQIFDPFFTTKEPGKGTGLGLSTAYGIIKQSGGHVFVDSEPGAGTLFSIYFPVSTTSEEARPAVRTQPVSAGADCHVLLVEDEEQVREFVAEVLRQAGYEVTDAGSGTQALELYEANPKRFQLLLTDVVMPGLRGTELADRIGEKNPELPVVFMSGYPGESDVAERLGRSGVTFLRKPFGPDELIDAIGALVHGAA